MVHRRRVHRTRRWLRSAERAASASGLNSRQGAKGEINNTPLVDETAIASASSVKPLLLDAFDLDDDPVLDDHPDLTIPNAADGLPDAVQIEICCGTRGESSFVVLRGSCNVWHTQLDTLARRTDSFGRGFHQRLIISLLRNPAQIIPAAILLVKTNILNLDRIN